MESKGDESGRPPSFLVLVCILGVQDAMYRSCLVKLQQKTTIRNTSAGHREKRNGDSMREQLL